jgi:hypothetical protein
MDSFTIFVLTTIPAGVSGIYLNINRQRINEVLLKVGNQYVNKYFSLNILRMIKAYKIGSTLTKQDKNLLKLAIFSRIIGLTTIYAWAIVFLFFLDKVLP